MGIKNVIQEGFDRSKGVFWEEIRGEVTDLILDQAILFFGEERVMKNFQNKMFWNIARPLISGFLPPKWKGAEILIGMSAEMQDALKRRQNNIHTEKEKKEEEKPKMSESKISEPKITIKEVMVISEFGKDFLYNLKSSPSIIGDRDLLQKILSYSGSREEIEGWVKKISEIGTGKNAKKSETEEKIRLSIDLMLMEKPKEKEKEAEVEKVLIWAEISGGKYPILELRIEALMAEKATTNQNKDSALFRYLETLPPSKLTKILTTLENMDEDDFQTEINMIYDRSPLKRGDIVVNVIGIVGARIQGTEDPAIRLERARNKKLAAKAKALALQAEFLNT